MGLDMYLRGHKITPIDTDILHMKPTVDGFAVESVDLSLGYWRKHWALHNYIEENYNWNDGIRSDDGGTSHLTADDLRDIAGAIETDHFLEGDNEFHLQPKQIAKTIKTLKDAAAWLDLKDGFRRRVTYYGSW